MLAIYCLASLVAQTVNNLPAMQETRVLSLSWEHSLEKEMATHSSILAWRIPWTEEPGRIQSMGLQRAGHDWRTNIFTFNRLLQHGWKHISYLTDSWFLLNQEFWGSLAGSSGWESLLRFHSWCKLGLHYLKAWPGLEDPLPRRFIYAVLVVGRGTQFLNARAFPQAA